MTGKMNEHQIKLHFIDGFRLCLILKQSVIIRRFYSHLSHILVCDNRDGIIRFLWFRKRARNETGNLLEEQKPIWYNFIIYIIACSQQRRRQKNFNFINSCHFFTLRPLLYSPKLILCRILFSTTWILQQSRDRGMLLTIRGSILKY